MVAGTRVDDPCGGLPLDTEAFRTTKGKHQIRCDMYVLRRRPGFQMLLQRIGLYSARSKQLPYISSVLAPLYAKFEVVALQVL